MGIFGDKANRSLLITDSNPFNVDKLVQILGIDSLKAISNSSPLITLSASELVNYIFSLDLVILITHLIQSKEIL